MCLMCHMSILNFFLCSSLLYQEKVSAKINCRIEAFDLNQCNTPIRMAKHVEKDILDTQGFHHIAFSFRDLSHLI